MKLVYVAHPYGGLIENSENANIIIQRLYKKYPNTSFVSPIHGIRCGYDEIEPHTGLAYCLTLLSRCDELLLCGDWATSAGCTAEAAFAIIKKISITYQSDWLTPIAQKPPKHA